MTAHHDPENNRSRVLLREPRSARRHDEVSVSSVTLSPSKAVQTYVELALSHSAEPFDEAERSLAPAAVVVRRLRPDWGLHEIALRGFVTRRVEILLEEGIVAGGCLERDTEWQPLNRNLAHDATDDLRDFAGTMALLTEKDDSRRCDKCVEARCFGLAMTIGAAMNQHE
ncbi:MAG: hypothetical protein AAFU77_04580 [Myxococcota bacterium]